MGLTKEEVEQKFKILHVQYVNSEFKVILKRMKASYIFPNIHDHIYQWTKYCGDCLIAKAVKIAGCIEKHRSCHKNEVWSMDIVILSKEKKYNYALNIVYYTLPGLHGRNV